MAQETFVFRNGKLVNIIVDDSPSKVKATTKAKVAQKQVKQKQSKQPSVDAPSSEASSSPSEEPASTEAQSAVPEGEAEGEGSVAYGIPPSMAEEYANVQQMYYFPLEDAMNELYNAYYDEDTAASTLAILAKRVIARDDALANFWARYHVAEDEAKGKVILPEVKQQLEAEKKKYESMVKRSMEAPHRELSSYSKKEIDEMISSKTIPPYILQLNLSVADIKEERIRRDKKYLRRNDRRAGGEYSDSLREAAEELHAWGEEITEAMERSCAKYGYAIPPEWVSRPTDPDKVAEKEAKAAEKKVRHNEAEKKRYAEKTAVTRAVRKAKKEELMKSFEGF